MRTIRAAFVGLLVTLVSSTAARAADGFTPKSIETRKEVRYLVSLPDGYDADRTNAAGGGKGWPLVLFLHGAGERGTDLDVVTNIGLPKLIKDGKKFPFVLIAPQCEKDGWWEAGPLAQLVKKVQAEYGCDVDRTYVTGLSMGGFGTWDLITRHGDLFAAAAPICGGGDSMYSWYLGRLGKLPVWAFHGEKDPIVPVQRTRDMVGTLRFFKNPNVKETIYPDVAHDSWDRAYADPELYTWMLAQKRLPPEPKK